MMIGYGFRYELRKTEAQKARMSVLLKFYLLQESPEAA
jgi:hypothetical protein